MLTSLSTLTLLLPKSWNGSTVVIRANDKKATAIAGLKVRPMVN